MPHVGSVRTHCRQLNRQIGQILQIPLGQESTPFRPGLKVLEFDAEDGPLHGVHAIVEANFGVMIAFFLSVIAQAAKTLGDLIIISDDRAPLAVSPQVLAGVKAKAAAQTPRAGELALVSGS